jgi:hypothetical protein
MAVATEQPFALEKTEHVKKSNGALFREAQGNEYEEHLNDQLQKALGSDYHQIPDYSNPNQVKIAASAGKIVIAQAPFETDFGNIVYSGRADLLVRNDYDLEFLEDGTIRVVQNKDPDSTSYNVWEIKHSSATDSKGKQKDLTNYEYQLGMAVEGIRSLGLGATRLAGILFKNEEILTFDPSSILDAVTTTSSTAGAVDWSGAAAGRGAGVWAKATVGTANERVPVKATALTVTISARTRFSRHVVQVILVPLPSDWVILFCCPSPPRRTHRRRIRSD